MITFTDRLDKAIRTAAWAHEQAKQHRKGSDIPYIIHPFGVMLVAGEATDDEDILIACLLHDVLEDVPLNIYDEQKMREDFGDHVLSLVEDVTKDESITDWHERSKAYIKHLRTSASDEPVIVSASDKIQNLMAVLTDYRVVGDTLWERFKTNNAQDQLWWYESILAVITKRKAPQILIDKLALLVEELRLITVGRG